MKRLVSIVPVLVALGACSVPRYADFGNLTVTVDVRHPPGVGFVVEEVAIAPVDRSRLPTRVVGADDLDPVTCRNELVQAVTDKLLELGIAVVQYGNRQGADAGTRPRGRVGRREGRGGGVADPVGRRARGPTQAPAATQGGQVRGQVLLLSETAGLRRRE